jgi:hypothetical protein
MGNVAQAVECPLCKQEALSSNPSPIKKKKKEKKANKKGPGASQFMNYTFHPHTNSMRQVLRV